MMVRECQDFNPEYPETFVWGHCDSPKLASLGNILSSAIDHDLRTPNRIYVPGLRQALNFLSGLAEI